MKCQRLPTGEYLYHGWVLGRVNSEIGGRSTWVALSPKGKTIHARTRREMKAKIDSLTTVVEEIIHIPRAKIKSPPSSRRA